jgi:hypothetical protein
MGLFLGNRRVALKPGVGFVFPRWMRLMLPTRARVNIHAPFGASVIDVIPVEGRRFRTGPKDGVLPFDMVSLARHGMAKGPYTLVGLGRTFLIAPERTAARYVKAKRCGGKPRGPARSRPIHVRLA